MRKADRSIRDAREAEDRAKRNPRASALLRRHDELLPAVARLRGALEAGDPSAATELGALAREAVAIAEELRAMGFAPPGNPEADAAAAAAALAR